MTDIQAGDVVVCVNVGNIRRSYINNGGYELRLGKAYRVEAVIIDDDDELCLRLAGVPNSKLAERFRKLDKATDDFTTQIKAIRPIREDA